MASLNSFFLLDCTNPFQFIYTADCIVPISTYNALSAVNVKRCPTFFTCISQNIHYCIGANLHIGAQTFNFPCSRRDLHKSLLHLMLKLPLAAPHQISEPRSNCRLIAFPSVVDFQTSCWGQSFISEFLLQRVYIVEWGKIKVNLLCWQIMNLLLWLSLDARNVLI